MPMVDNDPRRVSRGGRGKNQLSVSLERVKDLPTREALEAIVGFVSDMVAGGLSVDGDLTARALQLDTGGSFRVKIFELTIRTYDAVGDADITALKVPGSILGAFGYSQVDGTARWQVMPTEAVAGYTGAYWYDGTVADNTDRVVHVRNTTATDTSQIRAVVFYKGDRA